MPRPAPPLRFEPLEDRVVPAAIGKLDPAFNTLGANVAGFGDQDTGRAMVIAPDGKIVVAGSTAGGDMAVARFNPDGALDTSFGGGDGGLLLSFDLVEIAYGVAVQNDGKIVVVGETNVGGDKDFAVARILADGSDFDQTFGVGGKTTIDVRGGAGGDDTANDVAIQPDGSIVVVGFTTFSSTDTDFGVVRLLPNGDRDPNFGAGGRLSISFDAGGGNNRDVAQNLVIQPDGRIVIIGSAQTSASTSDFAAVRLQTNGDFDQSFGTGGKLRLDVDPFLSFESGSAVELDADGNYVVLVGNAPAHQFAVARLRAADGDGDQSFGTNGVIRTDYGSATFGDIAADLALQPDGKIVVAGRSTGNVFNGPGNFAVARYLPNGARDLSFNGSGFTTVEFGGNEQLADVELDAQGRIVLFGSTDASGSLDFAIARVIATTGLPGPVAVSGVGTGAVPVFAPEAGSVLPTYFTSPVANPTPIPGVAVNSALADVNGDGTPDLIVGQTAGGDRVVVLDGRDEAGGTVLASFSAFGGYAGGVYVAGGDLTNDGRADVVVSPVLGGLGPRVAVFSGASMRGATGSPVKLADFNGIADALSGAADNSPGTIQLVGARVAVADANGDGVADLAVAAGNNGGPRVTIWDGKNVAAAGGAVPGRPPLANAFVFEDSQRDGAFVTLGDVTSDGLADLIAGGGPNGGPRIRIGDMAAILAAKNFGKFDDQLGVVLSNFLVGDPNSRGGIRVAARDLDGDGIADLVTGSGARLASQVQVFRGTRLAGLTSGVQAGDQVFDPFGAVLADGVYVG